MKPITVLVVCDGNTCRSATLMLLLRYKASLQSVGGFVDIESAGLGRIANDAGPMRQVAQDAVAFTASRFLTLQGVSYTSCKKALTTLIEQAKGHQSAQVSVIDAISNHQTVISLLTSDDVKKLDPTRALHSRNTTLHHPVDDYGFSILRQYNFDEDHPKVIEAYQDQADKLARLVNGPLANLLLVP